MTEQRDSADTAAEPDMPMAQMMDDMEMLTTWGVLRGYHEREAALRRELDEARERHAISQSVAGDMASALDDARADNAKKDAALREAHNFGFWWWCGPANGAELDEAIKAEEASWAEFQTKAALAPAAQGETHDTPLLQKIRTTPSMYREVAYAPAPTTGK